MTASLSQIEVEYKSNVQTGARADKAALDSLASSVERVGDQMEQTDTAVRRVGPSFEAVQARLDGTAAATRRLASEQARHERQVNAVNEAFQRGEITLEQQQTAISRLGVLYEQASARAVAHGQAIESRFVPAHVQAVAAAERTGTSLRNLGIQSIDVFQQLASGAPVMMTLVQQGGQVAQMAAVTGTSLGALARQVGGVALAFAPWIAATAAAVALGATIYSVGARSAELAAEQRALSAAIQGVGRSADLSAGQLQGYVSQLKAQGVAAAEAMAAVSALARNSGVSGGMAGRIVALGPDAATALGVGVPEAMRMMAEAARGTREGINNLISTFNLLTPVEAANVRVMQDHGKTGEALAMVYGRLAERISGLNRDSLSPSEKAMRDLGNAWDGFIDRVAKSGPVLAVISQLSRDIQAVSGAVFGNTGEALGQEIVSLGRQIKTIEDSLAAETGSGRMADARRQSMQAALTEYRAREQSLIDRARAESEQMAARRGLGTTDAATSAGGSFAPPSRTVTEGLAETARQRVGSSTEAQIRGYRQEIAGFEAELARLGPRTAENAALFDTFTAAIVANRKSIEDAAKKNEEHRTGLEKSADTIQAQIRAANDLTAAYGQGTAQVQRVLAVQEAEKKAISEGLQPGMERYTAVVADLTGRLLQLNDAQARAGVAKRIDELDQATAAQQRITAAYDGTQESLTRAQNAERAYLELRGKLTEETDDFTRSVSSLAEAYNRSTDATSAFQHAQQSVSAVLDTLATAADRVAQGLVDATFAGGKGLISLANIAKSASLSILSDLVKLGAINPLINSIAGNAVRPTLGAGLGLLTGGAGDASEASGGGGNLLGGLSNVLSLGKITDSLGLTNLGGQLSGFTNMIGLTGDGGLLSIIGNGLGLSGNGGLLSGLSGGLNSLLSTTLWNGPAGSLAALGGAEYGGAALAAAGAPVSLGSLLGGAGLGFGAGSFAGGLLQNALGKVGPAPTIGAGVGAAAGAAIGSIIPGIGTIVGGLLGGLVGGGGGGLIGPQKATPFSATGLTVDSNGMLGVGRTVSQIVNTQAEVATLNQQVAQINAVLAASGTRIANATSVDEFGQNRLSGGNTGTWLNFGQGGGRPSDIAATFGELRFDSADSVLSRQLRDRSFGDIGALQSAIMEVRTFVDQTAPALIAMGDTTKSFGDGSLATQIAALERQYDDAIAVARRLGTQEEELTAARESAIAAARNAPIEALQTTDTSLEIRYMRARAANDNDVALARDAAIIEFDARAKAERDGFRDTLLTLLGDAGEGTALYVDQMARLDRALYQERLQLLGQFNQDVLAEDAQAQARRQSAEQAALGAVTSLADYARGLAYSDASPLSPQAQLDLAQRDFQAAASAARSGDYSSINDLPGVSGQLLTAARDVYGSGVDYAQIFEQVRSALEAAARVDPQTIVADAIKDASQDQIEVLGSRLERIEAVMADIRTELKQQAMAPKRAA